ncbi:MAG: ABC transporter substrate-binding protein [Spirochaetaceae bacterium]|jgi:putative ABC transport system substrate-binding protein|nr:ABC transporter substrate-binding protein [Spirochaetaceae bacterium]
MRLRQKNALRAFGLALPAVLSLAAFAAGCTRREGAERVRTIGIIQLADNGAFTDMREGFLDRLEELGWSGDKIRVDYRNAQGDIGALNTIAQEMAAAGYDAVSTIATPAAQAFVNQESETPLFFISVTDPVSAGIMGALDSPDRNATGTSNLVPVDEIFRLADTLTPGIRVYGFLYNTGEVNAVLTVRKAKAYLDGRGIAYVEATVTNSSEVQQAAESLAGRANAIYVPIDSMVQSAMPQVARIAREAKIPVYGSSPVMVVSGALATVSTEDRLVGAVTGEMVDRYFKGAALEEIPAAVMDQFYTVINAETADILGLALPASLEGAVLIGR